MFPAYHNIPSLITQVWFGEGGVYVALPLPYEVERAQEVVHIMLTDIKYDIRELRC